MPEDLELSPNQQAALEKRLSEVIGSVRHLALSDLEVELDDDEITLKADDADAPGRLIAQFSVAGIKDSYGDIITQAAFDEINGKALGMVWSHDRSRTIGRGVVRLEGKKAIWDGQLFVGKGVPDADMAHTVIKEMAKLQEYSWGFRVKEAKPIKEKGPDGQMVWMGGLEITKVDAIEVSPVLKGAHPKTKTLVIKADDVVVHEGEVTPIDAPATPDPQGMTVADEFEKALAAVSSFADRMQALDAKRMDDSGRHLGHENLGRLKELLDSLGEIESQIQTILKAAEAGVEVPIGDRFRFAEMQRRRLDLLTNGA